MVALDTPILDDVASRLCVVDFILREVPRKKDVDVVLMYSNLNNKFTIIHLKLVE